MNENRKTQRGERPVHALRTIARLFAYMMEHRALLSVMLLVILLSIACELLVPLCIEASINAIGFSHGIQVDVKGLTVSLAALSALILISALLGYGEGRISARLSLELEARLRRELISKLLNLPVSATDRRQHGDMMSRVMNDTKLAAQTFTEGLLSLAASMVVIAGCAVIMTVKSPLLAAISIGAALASVALTGLLSGLLFPRIHEQQRALGALNAHVEESLSAFGTSLSGGRMPYNIRALRERSREYCDRRIRAYRLEGIIAPVMLLLGNLNFLLLVLFGMRSILQGRITIGTMQAFILYSRQFMEPVNSLGDSFVEVQNSLAAAERIFELLDVPSEREVAAPAHADAAVDGAEAQIEFRDVSFGYRRGLPVLRGLNLRVRRGENVAVIGVTGVGKTTLLNLLMRFYDGYTGGVFVDGREIRHMRLAELRGRIVYAAQEPAIIDGTVAENIGYGSPEADPERIEAAARLVGIDRMIERLPEKYDTRLEREGRNISQGQLQMLSLARAVLRDPEILIMDEATSSVDPETEEALKSSIAAARRGRTSITIAHRIGSIRDADRIIVLQDGAVAEEGSFGELMAMRGIAFALFRNQSTGEEI